MVVDRLRSGAANHGVHKVIDKHGTVYVDNTTLRALASCDTRAVLRHVFDLVPVDSEERYPLECGIAVHEMMADYLQGKSIEYCLRKYELLYRGQSEDASLDDPEHPLYRLSFTNTAKILNAWFEEHPLFGFSFSVNPKLTEVGFSVPLSDECVCGHAEPDHNDLGCRYRGRCSCSEYHPAFVIWGRADAVVQNNADKSLYVLDHKTTKQVSPFWVEKFRGDSQMSGYVWAIQKTLGQTITGVYINAIEFSKLPSDPVRKCKKHGVVFAECGPLHMKSQVLIFTRTPEQLESWRQTAIALARRYRNLYAMKNEERGLKELSEVLQQGTFTGDCSFCDFKHFCSAGRPVHYASAMLTEKPWRPFPLEE